MPLIKLLITFNKKTLISYFLYILKIYILTIVIFIFKVSYKSLPFIINILSLVINISLNLSKSI